MSQQQRKNQSFQKQSTSLVQQFSQSTYNHSKQIENNNQQNNQQTYFIHHEEILNSMQYQVKKQKVSQQSDNTTQKLINQTNKLNDTKQEIKQEKQNQLKDQLKDELQDWFIKDQQKDELKDELKDQLKDQIKDPFENSFDLLELFQTKNKQFMQFFTIKDEQMLDFILKPKIVQVIKQRVWNIKYENYNMSWVNVLNAMKFGNAEQIWLIKNFNFCFQNKISPIQNICHIRFQKLKILRLDSNNIHNLQKLSFMDFYSLSELGLNENKIVSTKSMRKCTFEGLLGLGLWRNKIQTLQKFSQIKFHNQIIGFATEYYAQDKLQQSDISIASKLQSKLCDKIIINSLNRILQTKVFISLQQRYPKVTIKNQVYLGIN